MKITFNFDKDTRALALVPEDELELCVLNDIATRCAKGTTLVIEKITQATDSTDRNPLHEIREFRVEMKVNRK